MVLTGLLVIEVDNLTFIGVAIDVVYNMALVGIAVVGIVVNELGVGG